jgi:hypothetical protein
MQNIADSGRSAPQRVQLRGGATSAVPHDMQKFACSGFCV